jgi:hypothetical protein
MLPAQRRNPEIMGGNRFANLLQLQSDLCVVIRRLPVDVEQGHRRNPFPELFLVLPAMPRLGNPEPVLP